MSELIDVVYTAEVKRVATLPTGKFKEVKDKNNRVIRRRAIFADKEVVVAPPKKKVKYFDANEQREKTAVIEFHQTDDGLYHAFFAGALTVGVPEFVAAKLLKSRNYKVNKAKAKPVAKDEPKEAKGK